MFTTSCEIPTCNAASWICIPHVWNFVAAINEPTKEPFYRCVVNFKCSSLLYSRFSVCQLCFFVPWLACCFCSFAWLFVFTSNVLVCHTHGSLCVSCVFCLLIWLLILFVCLIVCIYFKCSSVLYSRLSVSVVVVVVVVFCLLICLLFFVWLFN